MLQGKYKIEINFVGDGRIFINYWDYMHGEDVVAEFVDGQLYDSEEEITFAEYLERVKSVVSKY